MSRLIYNEVYKIFHRKTTVLFLIIVLVQFIFIFGMINYNKYYNKKLDYNNTQMAKERIAKMDLDKLSEYEHINTYIEDMTQVQAYKYYKKYGTGNWKRYLFDEEALQFLTCMNSSKYRRVNEKLYKDCETRFNDIIKEIDSHDWKYFVNKYHDEALVELKSLQESYEDEENENNKPSIMLSIKSVQLEIDGYKYHLINDVPIDYSSKSVMISDYVSDATEYLSTEKDDSKYKEYNALLDKRNLEARVNEYKYMLDNNLDPVGPDTASGLFTSYTCTSIIMVIVYLLMISGYIVTEEFNKGTIKQLLVRPYSRTKILISKILATIIVVSVFWMIYILIAFIFCGLAYGFKSYFSPIIIYDFTTHAIKHMSLLRYLLINTMSYLPQYLILMALSIFLGVLLLNEALAIGIPILALIVSSFVLQYTYIPFLKYFPTICWEFNDFLWGGLPSYKGLDLKVNLIVSLFTFLVFIFGSISLFKGKDIKNQ